MKKMKGLMDDPNAMKEQMESKEKEFAALPEDIYYEAQSEIGMSGVITLVTILLVGVGSSAATSVMELTE